MTSVLLVDDSDALRSLYRLSIESLSDLRIIAEATNGAEAIAQARNLHPQLVLLDLSMPKMDGLEALAALREENPGSHVVVLTGFKNERLGTIAKELGASDYIEKGLTPTELVERLRLVLATAPPEPHDLPAERRAALERRARELI